MLSPDFDPLAELTRISDNQIKLNNNIMEIARAVNERSEALMEMAKVINRQDQAIRDLHARLQLLEVARQYETTKHQE